MCIISHFYLYSLFVLQTEFYNFHLFRFISEYSSIFISASITLNSTHWPVKQPHFYLF